MLKTKKLLLPLVIGALLGSQQVFAASIQNFRLRPVGDLWGFAGKGEVAQGQLILPFMGDINSVWFGDAEGRFGTSKNDWFLGAAAGYRKVINDRILGGYLALNYNKAKSGLHTWIANPGIESLGTIWDFRANGYFSISTPNYNAIRTNTDWADKLDVYDYVRFTGHLMYNRLQTDTYKTDVQMGRGFDAEVGRTIPFIKNLKFYLGGYHFDTKSIGSINGVATRLTYQLNDYVGLEAKYNYDNYQHNIALLGIKFTINGMNSAEKNAFGISARLLDNIEHNFGSISNGTAVPIKRQIQHERIINPTEQIQNPNVWFVDPEAAAGGDGTFEHPLNDFNEAILADIEKTSNPTVLLIPGTYNLDSNNLGLSSDIVMHNIEIDGANPAYLVDVEKKRGKKQRKNAIFSVRGADRVRISGDTTLENIDFDAADFDAANAQAESPNSPFLFEKNARVVLENDTFEGGNHITAEIQSGARLELIGTNTFTSTNTSSPPLWIGVAEDEAPATITYHTFLHPAILRVIGPVEAMVVGPFNGNVTKVNVVSFTKVISTGLVLLPWQIVDINFSNNPYTTIHTATGHVINRDIFNLKTNNISESDFKVSGYYNILKDNHLVE